MVLILADPKPPFCTVRTLAIHKPSGDLASAFQIVGAFPQPVSKKHTPTVNSKIALRIAARISAPGFMILDRLIS
jgi:hypothetical protein